MNNENAWKEAKEHLQEYVESITTPDRKAGKNMYVCPLCKSGTGKHGTGAFSITKDGLSWKCFACDKGGDLCDLIGLVEKIPNRLDQLKRAGQLYGIEVETNTYDNYQKPAQNQPKNEQYTDMNTHTNTYTYTDTEDKYRPVLTLEENYIDYFKDRQKHLKETSYYAERGISEEVADRFMLGYEPEFTKGTGGKVWQALIIPISKDHYIARNIDPNADEKNRYRKVGENIPPFNNKALKTATSPIFIVEGEIDALSIIEIGGEAIGLGSTSKVDKFIQYVKDQTPVQPLILALDNDQKGKQATEKLVEQLKKLSIDFYRPQDLYNGLKDANTALLADREAFKKAVEKAVKYAEDPEEAQREEYLQTSAYSHIEEFLNDIADSVNTQHQPTGFTKLDNVLDGGLYEGLYVIGAITSLGKTTLALQIADQIAQSGKDVLIFSLEMARTELMSKSISRHTLIDVLENNGDIHNAKTNRGITEGARYEKYSPEEKTLIAKAIRSYKDYAQHIFIHEGIGSINVDYIRETIQKHISFTGNTPVVLVDYIQILAPYDVRATDKQNTDKAVLELKRISRDYKTPVIGISSFNRASYKEKVTLEAFKESGSLEYGSDVLIGLQLEGAGSKDFDSTEAKKQNPRNIELVILKNRNGQTGDTVAFNYYPAFNYFKEL